MKKVSEKSRRAKIAYAFQCVVQYLWDGDETKHMPGDRFEFICYCLDQAFDCGEITMGVRQAAQTIVHRRLGEAPTLPMWLTDMGVPLEQQTAPAVQAHRLAWIKLLVKEFQGPAR